MRVRRPAIAIGREAVGAQGVDGEDDDVGEALGGGLGLAGGGGDGRGEEQEQKAEDGGAVCPPKPHPLSPSP
jgi:hypothetical protein